jgi:hypothetical protein
MIQRPKKKRGEAVHHTVSQENLGLAGAAWINLKGNRLTCVRPTEEGGQQHSCGRPEGHRQGSDRQHQEGRVPAQLPRKHLQPAKG